MSKSRLDPVSLGEKNQESKVRHLSCISKLILDNLVSFVVYTFWANYKYHIVASTCIRV